MEQVWNGFRVEAAQESCTIRRYEDGAERVCVPERLGGLPVKSIGGGAFAGQVQLREVILPDSVTVIDHHAFLCLDSPSSLGDNVDCGSGNRNENSQNSPSVERTVICP